MKTKGKLTRAVAAVELLENRKLFAGQPFTTGSPLPTVAVAVADFNGDGKLDYVTGNEDAPNSNGSLTVGLGVGDGTFTALPSVPVSLKPFLLETGDLDGDGKVDLVVTGYSGAGVSVMIGNGDGTFDAPTTVGPGKTVSSIEIADLNKDEDPDLIFADASSSISFALGNGDGTFASPDILPAGFGPGTIRAGDLNKDGNVDLVVLNVYDSLYGAQESVSVLIGHGDGTFEPQMLLAGGSKLASLDLGDVNGDGFLDIVTRTASYFDPNSINILFGKAGGEFDPIVSTNLDATGFGQVRIADVTGDGVPDLVTQDYDTVSLMVLKGKGDGTFPTSRKFVIGEEVTEGLRDFTLGDLNNDQRLDATIVRNGSSGVNAGITLTEIAESYQYHLELGSSLPATRQAGQVLSPIQVVLKNSDGQTVTDDPVTVTLTVTFTLPPANGGGSSSMTFTGNTVNGIATFSNVALTAAGVNGLQATSAGVTATATSNVNVTPGTAARVDVVQSPGNALAGQTLSPITVAVVDVYGNAVDDDSSIVTLSLPGVTLTGTTTAQVQNGFATFSNVSITKPGTNYQLQATTSVLPSGFPSGFVTIAALGASRFSFLTQPVNVTAGGVFSVSAVPLDDFGNFVSIDLSGVQLSVSGPGDLLTQNAPSTAGGTVTFTGLTLGAAGLYTLTLGDGTATPATVTFPVSAGAAAKIVFTQIPVNGVAGTTLSETTVAIQDAFSNVISTDSSTVSLTLMQNGSPVTLTGPSSVAAVIGLARFSSLSISAAGTYQLLATNGTFTATSAEFVILPGFVPSDAVAPVAAVAPVLPPTTASPRLSFTVIYSDNQAIDLTTISADNFTLSSITTGTSLKFVPQVQSDSTDKRVRVIYTLEAPAGGFRAAADYVLASLDPARDLAGNPTGSYLNNFAITRAAPGGSNPNFGGGTGQVVTPNTDVQFLIQDSFQASVTDPIYSVGFAIDAGHTGQIVVIRQNPDGSSDATFDGDGVKSFSLPDATFVARTVNFNRDGTILVTAQKDGIGAYLLVRLDVNGAQIGEVVNLSEAPVEEITVVRTSTDGKRLLIGGRSGSNLVVTSLLTTGKGAGNLDRSFGTAGQFIQPVGDDANATISDITVSKTGDIYVGSVKGDQPQVIKLSSKGKGAVAVTVSLSDVSPFASVDRVVVDPLGRVVFTVATADSADDAARGATGTAVVRLAFDKKKQLLLDPTFEGDGRVLVDRSSSSATVQGNVRVKLESITLVEGDLRSAGKTGVTAPAGGNIYNLARSSADGSQTQGISLVADAGDLSPQTLKVTGKKPIKAGSVIAAAVKISNIGTLTTSGDFLATLILTNSATGAIFTIETTGTLGSLLPGKSSTVSPISFTLPTDLAAGTYQVNVQVDGVNGGASDFVPGSTLKKPVSLKTA